MLGQSQSSGEIDGGGGLTHAALLVDYRERLGYLISPLMFHDQHIYTYDV
jgi:hypothetical protein